MLHAETPVAPHFFKALSTKVFNYLFLNFISDTSYVQTLCILLRFNDLYQILYLIFRDTFLFYFRNGKKTRKHLESNMPALECFSFSWYVYYTLRHLTPNTTGCRCVGAAGKINADIIVGSKAGWMVYYSRGHRNRLWHL